MDTTVIFYLLLAVMAFLYASVGHGGASGYLALMALWSISPALMKPTALLLNILVSGIAFWNYYRSKHFQWGLFWPFALASIPMAFVGGMITIDTLWYKKLLGVLLLVPVARFLFVQENPAHIRPLHTGLALTIGSIIGLLSGLTGIGGGILLSPMLLLLYWANQKQAAAVSALFILVNSIAGLAGLFTKGLQFSPDMYYYVLFALAGGFAGAYMGARKFNHQILRYVLAVVLLIAAWKLLLT